jgi:flagellar hook-basal body complex protein FliE
MLKINANVNPVLPNAKLNFPGEIVPKAGAEGQKSQFTDAIKAVEKHISKIDDLQESSDTSIKDLLTGKNEDITSVVSAVAKADIGFKVLVGVRNKLIEAYKQTMNMQI